MIYILILATNLAVLVIQVALLYRVNRLQRHLIQVVCQIRQLSEQAEALRFDLIDLECRIGDIINQTAFPYPVRRRRPN